MNRKTFVDTVRLVVRDAAATNTISNLTRPPGRQPEKELSLLSTWFNGLDFGERQKVEMVVAMAAGDAVFGFLCVLDGCRAIEDGSQKGTLDLRYRRDNGDMSLTDGNGEMLHDLL